jgi:PAS domain S-box-containing protein
VKAHADAFRTPGVFNPTFLSVPDSSHQALMVIPRCAAARCSDLFIGVLDARQLLAAVVADTVLGFQMAIGNSREWLSASGALPAGLSRYVVTEPIIRNGPAWRVGVWPSVARAAITPSRLSDIVLLLGLAISVLLATALRLAQSLSQSARLEERARIDLAVESTTDGLWEWDLASERVTRSAQVWTRLGYPAPTAPVSMQEWLALIHPEDRAAVQTNLDEHLEGRSDAIDAQYRVRNAEGRWHNFEDRGRVVLRSADGRPLRVMGMFADITDRKNAESTLRQSETLSTMGRLAARIAHEINNPLAGIQSAFLLIKDAIPPTHPHVKYVGAIEREVARIGNVTRQLY